LIQEQVGLEKWLLWMLKLKDFGKWYYIRFVSRI
jgi:hypothetical protein